MDPLQHLGKSLLACQIHHFTFPSWLRWRKPGEKAHRFFQCFSTFCFQFQMVIHTRETPAPSLLCPRSLTKSQFAAGTPHCLFFRWCWWLLPRFICLFALRRAGPNILVDNFNALWQSAHQQLPGFPLGSSTDHPWLYSRSRSAWQRSSSHEQAFSSIRREQSGRIRHLDYYRNFNPYLYQSRLFQFICTVAILSSTEH